MNEPTAIAVTYCDKCGRDNLIMSLKARHFVNGALCVGGELKTTTLRPDGELIPTIQFLMSQIEHLARIAFSEDVEDWLEKCDAYQSGKRAIGKAKK